MFINRETVLSDVIVILENLIGDWELVSEISEASLVLEELGLESIDAVALGTEIDEKYHRQLPFARFLIELQGRERRDFTVGQLVDFVTRELCDQEIEVTQARVDQIVEV